MSELFARVSFPVLALAAVVLFVLVSLSLLFAIQKLLKRLHFDNHTDFGEIFSDAIGVIFSLILAFVTISVWENYNNTSDVVSREASTLHSMYRNLDSYPPGIRDAGQQDLRDYVREVIDVEWPMLANDQRDPLTYPLLRKVNALIVDYKPTTLGELPVQQEMLRLLSTYRELRRDRVEGAKGLLDSAMWTVLLTSCFITIVYSCMFKMQDIRIHAFMLSSLAASLGLIFALLLSYSSPYSGPSAISPEPFVHLLDYYWAH